jgi:CheY-specific phosphatase CheX
MDTAAALLPDEQARAGILMDVLLNTARRFLGEDFGIELLGSGEQEPTIVPGELTSSLEIGGAVEGTIFLSCGKEMTKLLLQKIVPDDPVTEEEDPSMLGEALNEILNMIAGACTQALSAAALPIRVFPPNAVQQSESVVKAALAKTGTLGVRVDTVPGTIQLLFARNLSVPGLGS